MAEPVEQLQGGAKGRDSERSPNFPSLTLEEAIKKAQVIWDREKRAYAPVKVIYKHWGYSPTSSGGRSVLAALNAFGFLDFKGSGDEREAKLNQRALTIIIDPANAMAHIQAAATAPKLYGDLLKHYPDGMPSDATLRSHLILNRGFNDRTVDAAIRDFKATMEFAKVNLGGTCESKPDEKPDELKKNVIVTGCFVQWISQGAAQFPSPRKVLGLSDDGAYAFVEGAVAGVPVDQLTVESPVPATAKESQPPPNPFTGRGEGSQAGTAQATFPLSEGLAVLRWPENMSRSSFEDFEAWISLLLRKAKRSIDEVGGRD